MHVMNCWLRDTLIFDETNMLKYDYKYLSLLRNSS